MGGGYCRRPPGADEGDLGTVRGGCSQNHHLPGEFSDNFFMILQLRKSFFCGRTTKVYGGGVFFEHPNTSQNHRKHKKTKSSNTGPYKLFQEFSLAPIFS